MIPTHAFVDESRRADRYLLAAALVASRDVQLTTRRARERLPAGRRRAHFSDEGNSVRRRILDGYVRLAPQAVVVIASYGGGDDQQSRDACMSALFPVLVAHGVQALVFDTRGPDRDKRDRQHIARLVRRSDQLDRLHYVHRGSRDEPLLGLPDAIAWAYGAGGIWLAKIRPIIIEELRA